MRHWPFSNKFEDWVDAIEGRDDFKMYSKEGYYIFNYVSIMAEFETPDDVRISDKERLHRALRYNMRGAIFDAETKELIRLPLHKFHNLNEKTENQFDKLDWSEYEAYSKMDGSMIAPFALDNGSCRLIWGSKMGETHLSPDVEAFVSAHMNYHDFAERVWEEGSTPIFEYVGHPVHRIVIDYPVESLILLAIRSLDDGIYWNRKDIEVLARSYGIPIVKRWEIEAGKDPSGFIDEVSNLKGEEGVVIRFPNDHRVKVKAEDYVLLHKTRSAVETERYVAVCILNETIDDLIPLVPEHVRTNLRKYVTDFLAVFKELEGDMVFQVVNGFASAESAYDNAMFENNDREQRKHFALNTDLDPYAKRIGFKLWGHGHDIDFVNQIKSEVKDMVIKYAESSETKFEHEVRHNLFKDQLPEWSIWVESGEA